MRARGLAILLALAAGTTPAARSSFTFLTDGLRSVYPVELGLAVPGADSVEVDGRLLSPAEYELNYAKALLMLTRRPGAWSVVRVSSDVIPFGRASYRLHGPPVRLNSSDTTVMTAPADTVAEGQEDLDITGSKTVGVVIGGGEGSGLNQATRLSVKGTVEGVTIDAELSDQSSPIPPEGTTLELEELDLIRIALAGRGWHAGFGDVQFRLPTAGFGTLERRVVGGTIDGELGPVGARVGYARPRGRFDRVELAGIDGVQGPYILAPDGRGATLVAGSEEVSLDGRRMTRGWDADYTIDYSTGELAFTNRHVIDRFSRIEAGYQYTLDAWERSDVLGGVTVALGPVCASADYFRESDDPDISSSYELSDEDREYLAGIGGDTSLAWLDGAERVADSAGDYVAEDGHYRYVGDGRGDFRVRFTYVGELLGDYAYDDTLLAHSYVGPDAGDYVAQYRVELPGRSEIVRVGLNLDAGGLQAGVEGLGRRGLVNLFASGGAPSLDGAIAARADWSADSLTLGYRGRVLAPGFRYPGGDSLVDFGYRWGGLNPEQVRHANELAGSYNPRNWLEFGGDLGLLATDTDSLLSRWLGRCRVGPVSAEGGRAGRELRASVAARPLFGRFSPRAAWRQAWSGPGGRRTIEAGLGYVPVDGLELDAGYRDIRADTTDSAGIRSVHELGGVAEFGASWRAGDWLTTTLRTARQARSYPGGGTEGWNSWLTGGNVTVLPRAGLRLRGDIEQSRRLVQLRDESYRHVGPGKGSYSRDTLTGRYYFDPDGEYERVLIARGSYVPASELALNLSGDWSAWRPLALTATASRVELTDSAPVQRSSGFNARATLRALEPVVTAWLTATGSSTLDRTLVVSGRTTDRLRYQGEVQSDRRRAVELRARVEYATENREATGGGVEYTERLVGGALEPIVGRRLRLELEFGAERSIIAEPTLYPELGTFSLLSMSGSAGRNWALGGRWRLRVRGGVTRRTASVDEVPYDIALTRPPGWMPTALFEVSHLLGDALTLVGRYDFADRPDRAADHRVSAELRAIF